MHSTRESLVSHFHPHAFQPAAVRARQNPHHAPTFDGVSYDVPLTLTSLLGQPAANDVPDVGSNRLFTIRAADSQRHRSSAGILIDRMYATRGYRTNGLPSEPRANRITLTACEHEEVMGTLTVGIDSADGLYVDELFRDEVDALRQRGRAVCEFTKFAVDGMVKSKHVLASLFHVAYIYARRLNRLHDLLIEVNPRHVRYYERMLGFVRSSEERLNPRVDAPAVLMALDLAHAEAQIERFGGRPQLAANERSLYPHFFSPAEEHGIVGRLRRR